MLDANRLRVLVEIAHAGSIAAAADRLSFTPPALSQQLTKLEREVGTRLVERGRTGATLTRAGEVLLEHGERVLGELRDAEAAVRAVAGDRADRLSLGAFASAGKVLLPGALAAFGHEHPHVRLSLSDIEPPGGLGLVTSGDLDLLITHRYPGVPLPRADGLHRERLLVDPYETRDYEVALALITAGVGIALIPQSILDASHGGGWVSRPLHGARLAREIYTVHRPRPPEPVPGMVATLRRTAARSLRTRLPR